jgi:hypothetical protein
MRERLLLAVEAEFGKQLEKISEIADSATRAVVVPGTRDNPGYVEIVEDLALQLKAIQDLWDRAMGKATAVTEIHAPEPEPVIPTAPPSRERLGEAAEILNRAGALDT